MAEPFIGQISLFGFNFAVRGWAFCAGQLMPIEQNTALFSLLGTTYGGDGRVTYMLPDFRGRVPLSSGGGTSPGLSSYRIGETGGVEQRTLSTLHMPAHSHEATATTTTTTSGATQFDPTGQYLAAADIYGQPSRSSATMAADSTKVTVDQTGGSQPINMMQPYLAVSFEIAMIGIYPSRA